MAVKVKDSTIGKNSSEFQLSIKRSLFIVLSYTFCSALCVDPLHRTYLQINKPVGASNSCP